MVERKHPLSECERCPLQRERAVPSDGPQEARYAAVGEAPGRMEQAKGRPFIGPSGKLLNATLADAGIDRSDVYATNTVLCRPPGKDAKIPDKAVECCRPRLQHELANLPKLEKVLATGNTSATELLGYRTKITRDRIGQPRPAKDYYDNVTVVPSVHPAAILRSHDHFPTFVRDVHKLNNNGTLWKAPTYEVYNSEYQARRALSQIPQGAEIAVDVETTVEKDMVFEHPDNLICVGIATSTDYAFVIERNALASSQLRADLAKALDRANVIYHNGKFDVSVLWQQMLIISTKNSIYGDTMLASYCLDERPGHHSLDELSQDLLASPDWKSVTKDYDDFESMPMEVLDEYNAYDVVNTLRLWEKFKAQLNDENQHELHDLLCRISEHLVHVEHAGIRVNIHYLEELDREFSNGLELLEQTLSKWVDNPRSWQQVMLALQTSFGVETPSTDKDHLTQILKGAKQAQMYELASFMELMLEHRKQTKLLGTYVRGIKKRLTDDNRIKPNLTLHSTTTGRTSSKNPNLQNVPRESGIRNAFIPDSEDYVLLYADFNNIEGRIVAVLANDSNLQDMFKQGIKPHKLVAESSFGSEYDSEEYVLAKSVVHGVNYKRTPHGIAEGLDMPLDKATKVYNQYMKMAPMLPVWHNEVYQQVIVDQEDLITPFGRKRRFDLVTKENMDEVWREAVAFKPQSIASDVNTLAGCRLREEGYDVRLLVHDASLVQVERKNSQSEADKIAKLMQESAEMNYPFIEFPVEVGIGDNWGDCE